MRSLEQIMNLAQADDFTKANAEAIVKEQVEEMVSVLHYQPWEAKKIVLANIGYYCGYYPAELADKVYEMFDTEHPVFGRTHPTPEEAFRLGQEWGQRAKEKAQGISGAKKPEFADEHKATTEDGSIVWVCEKKAQKGTE